MSNNIENKDELKEAMVDVRRAFRLLKEYQQRVLSIAGYIKDKYGMPLLGGNRHFCDSLKNRNSCYSNINITHDMWAWDFLYGYEFEYFFGVKEKGENKFGLTMLQASDTGFYLNENQDKNNIETFGSVEGSETLLVLIFQKDVGEKSFWNGNENILDRAGLLYRKDKNILNPDDPECENLKMLAMSFPMERFLDRDSTDSVLKEFSDKVKEKFQIELSEYD